MMLKSGSAGFESERGEMDETAAAASAALVDVTVRAGRGVALKRGGK